MTKVLSVNEYPDLPKWPAAYVTGKSVTVDQAKDIILRTDRSVQYISDWMGNNQVFADMFNERSGWASINALTEQHRQLVHKDPEAAAALKAEHMWVLGNEWEMRERWRERMQIISPEYPYNDWIASSYIYGPTGWCHPDGTIYVEGHNYGKWPSVSDIVRDWQLIAEAFPYVDLHCTMFDREAHDDGIANAVVTIKVVNGVVTVYAPDLSMHDPKPDHVKMKTTEDVLEMFSLGRSREQGLPLSWVYEFCDRSNAVLQALKEGN